MDQIKIGKLIAACRKKEQLTQLQLAERLNVTDRAVSKWETGRSLPDSAIMLELCAVLKISVTDLLCGEVVSVEQYNKQLEEKLLDMIKQKEENDKRLLAIEVVLGVLSTLILIAPIMAAGLLTLPDWQRAVLIFSGVIPAAIGFAFAMKIEQIAGYYECRLCGHRYVPTIKAMNAAMHMGRTRYLRCPKCQRKSWQKKVIEKE